MQGAARSAATAHHAPLNEIFLSVGRRRLYLAQGRVVSTASPPAGLERDAIDLLASARLRPDQMVALRGFWRPHGVTRPLPDGAYLAALVVAIRHGQVRAAALAAPPAVVSSPPVLAKPKQPPPQGGDLQSWTWAKRLHYVLSRTVENAPAAMREGCRDLLSGTNLALMLAGIAVLAAANYTPAGWLADLLAGAAAFGTLLWVVGSFSLALEVMEDLLTFVTRFARAKSKTDLDAASDALLKAIRAAGPAVVLMLLHAKVKGRAGGAPPPEETVVAPAKGVEGGKALPRAKPSGAMQTYYPPNDGFAGPPASETLAPGARVDRYGYEGGTYVAPEGTPDWMRSLPPGTTDKPYNIYEVAKPLDVQAGKAAPWFNQLGGGTQYKLPMSVGDAVKDGYLRRVGP